MTIIMILSIIVISIMTLRIMKMIVTKSLSYTQDYDN